MILVVVLLLLLLVCTSTIDPNTIDPIIETYHDIDGIKVSTTDLITNYRRVNMFNQLVYGGSNRFEVVVSELLLIFNKYGYDNEQFGHILNCHSNGHDSMCLIALFLRLLIVLYHSKVLPYSMIWSYGSFELLYVERWFNETGVDMITNHSNSSDTYRCLEWDKPRQYTSRYFNDLCKHRDSFNYNNGITSSPTYDINHNGDDYYGDILVDTTVPNDHYDLIVSTQVIEHINEPSSYISILHSKLKTKGLLILTGPHLTPVHGYPSDYYRYTNNGIHHLLTKNNFTIIQSHEYGNVLTGVLMILGIPTKYIHDKYKYSDTDDSLIHQQFVFVASKG